MRDLLASGASASLRSLSFQSCLARPYTLHLAASSHAQALPLLTFPQQQPVKDELGTTL